MAERALVDRLDDAIDALLAGTAAAADVGSDLAPLAAVAGPLRFLPSGVFKDRLRTELEREVVMAAGTMTQRAFHSVSPLIIHERAPELVEFVKRTFGADEQRRETTPAVYGFYAELRIGDSVLMIGGGDAAERGNLPGAFHVYVDDCDAAYARALAAGATTLAGATGEPADRPYGERSAYVEDPFGNYWFIATRRPARGEAQPPGSVLPYLHPSAGRKHLEFLKNAFGAVEIEAHAHGGRIAHAVLRIGDATLELGEPEDRTGIPTGGFFVRVADVDAAYARALDAGATTVRPPDDIPYGYRSAIVRDDEGYLWWPARLLTDTARSEQ